MNETLTLLLAWSAGGLLGAIFFGGLWWTIAKGTLSKHPALWFTGSLALRMSIVLAGFYFVCDHHCERLLLCLTGFIVAGLAITLMTKEKQTSPFEETSHAP
jgi:F1F0 ATPase subunit 2